ncbi:hypothetical protein [Luteipulveratus halotolerans]|uniref:Uncharacterized protein n=1 Tax=Luteipulveratus halotolerans TaxID=1631356 RepID=A0A0L6CEH2_9MICO|nr:hypothetical protein [Luteipulveratus halotolerans]KNX35908.1 hypothetical protein VV01_21880 [Luteipulveratus halotolerans]
MVVDQGWVRLRGVRPEGLVQALAAVVRVWRVRLCRIEQAEVISVDQLDEWHRLTLLAEHGEALAARLGGEALPA